MDQSATYGAQTNASQSAIHSGLMSSALAAKSGVKVMSGFVQPTTWNLSNTATGLQVSYSVAGPNLHYHQGAVVKDFTGNQIRVAEVPDVGTLVSVTTQMVVDSGSTTFTLLLPRVNLPAPPALPAAVPVTTDGVTTLHRFSTVLAMQNGQQEAYTVTPLQGTAS
jgi:hypothetical protein